MIHTLLNHWSPLNFLAWRESQGKSIKSSTNDFNSRKTREKVFDIFLDLGVDFTTGYAHSLPLFICSLQTVDHLNALDLE